MWGKADDLALAYITLARIQLAQGDRTGAVGTIGKAVQLVQTCGVFTEARSAVETAQVKMWLAQGDGPAVDRWSAALKKRFSSPDPFRFEDELTHITQARVFIAQRNLAEAVGLLSRLEETSRSGGRQGRLIEILILKALALHAVGDTAQADMALAESLALAEPEGYLRIFLEEGEAMRVQIGELRMKMRKPNRGFFPEQNARCIAYIERILAEFSIINPATPVVSGDRSSALVEPLTPREQDVLRLVAQGCSNRQVADTLVLAEGTVKYYVHVILEKLGVQTRTQAIARARDHNLI
jgi:LuxR family maltose regulon positive regulatory protein